MYLHLLDSPSMSIITKYETVSMPGHYALVRSVAENVFQDVPRLLFILQSIKSFWLIKNESNLWMGQRN